MHFKIKNVWITIFFGTAIWVTHPNMASGENKEPETHCVEIDPNAVRRAMEDKAVKDKAAEQQTPTLIQQILNGVSPVITPENANAVTKAPLQELDVQKLPESLWQKFSEDTGLTPLMVATALAQPKTVTELLEKGANRGATSKKWKLTAIAIACSSKSYDTARILLGSPNAAQFRVEIDLTTQRLNVLEENIEIFSSAISTGNRDNPTPTGAFIITEKYGEEKISTLYDANMPYFMRLNLSAVGIHAGELPGYPASHGCIRMPYAKAKELNKLIPKGTLVVISHQAQDDT